MRFMVLIASLTLDLVAAAAFSVDQNLATMIGVLIATVVVVMSIISYIDKRIEHKLNNKEAIDIIRHSSLVKRIDDLQALVLENLNHNQQHERKSQ